MPLLISILRDLEKSAQLSELEWDLLIRQARSTELLSHLHQRLVASEHLISTIPAKALNHLVSESVLAKKQHDAGKWEVLQICNALQNIGIPVILLKGAAYLQAGLPNSRGRFFGDIDILVPRHMLADVESKLQYHGWLTTHHDAYDQRYYRQWMHEIPPLQHVGRRSTIDVHHSILPLTARLHPDPEKLIADSVLVEGQLEVYVLSPEDMVLHSATHLFHDGELEHGLRDLVDLDRLFQHFSADAEFWQRLVDRSVVLELSRPLYYAMRYTSQVLGTPIPEQFKEHEKLDRPGSLKRWFMDKLFLSALMPAHHSCDSSWTPVARWCLYVRSHYLRMPLHLLIPHLLHKSIIRPYEDWKDGRKADKLNGQSEKKKSDAQEIDIFE